VRPEAVTGDRLVLDAAETRHLARVLRLGAGDVLLAVDGLGSQYTVRLTRVEGGRAEGAILARAPLLTESPLRLALAQGVPKGDKMDGIVRMATELGAAAIHPLLTRRALARPVGERWAGRLARWQRIAREAAKQSGRAAVPQVSAPAQLESWLAGRTPGLLVCLWEDETARLDERLPPPPVRAATLVIGPEGGLEAAEVEALRAAGAVVAGLGPRILRTETAGPVGLALLQARYGDLGARAASAPP
jgi:16S rRNA (uracil1498-N3)-methyltransferase